MLDFADESFDLAVRYLSLIDIADLNAAVAEMVRIMEWRKALPALTWQNLTINSS
jgi:hypothetical protein